MECSFTYEHGISRGLLSSAVEFEKSVKLITIKVCTDDERCRIQEWLVKFIMCITLMSNNLIYFSIPNKPFQKIYCSIICNTKKFETCKCELKMEWGKSIWYIHAMEYCVFKNEKEHYILVQNNVQKSQFYEEINSEKYIQVYSIYIFFKNSTKQKDTYYYLP